MIQYIPDSGIQIFAYRFHAHSLAVKITARHYRDNYELEPIAIDEFNSNYQVDLLSTYLKKIFLLILRRDLFFQGIVQLKKERNISSVIENEFFLLIINF